jgi:signal transduction histidine kinase
LKEKTFDWYSMSRKILLSAITIPIILTLFFSAAAFLNGSPGFKVDKAQKGLWVSQITDSQRNAVQTGDLIIAVNSIPYAKVLGHLVLQDEPSPLKTITLLRNGKQLTLSLKTIPFSLSSFILLAWPHFLLITVFLTLAVIAIIYAPPSPTTRLFYLMLCGFSSALASTLVSHTGLMNPTLISMSFFCIALSNWFSFGAWIHFSWRFPAERDLLINHSRRAAFFYLLPPAIVITTALYISGASAEFWPWMQRLRNIFLPVIILATFAKHTIDVIKLPPQPARNQIKLPLAAYWLSFGPYFVLYLLPNLLIDHPLIHFRTVILTFLFLPMAYLFALLRYRLFQVDKMISKILSYILLIISLTVLYSIFLIILKRWLWQKQILSEELFMVFLVIVVAFFNPIANRLQKAIDRVIFGNRPISPLFFRKFSRQISTALDIPELIRAISHDLPKQFSIDRAAMLILNNSKSPHLPNQIILDSQKWASSELVNTLTDKKSYLYCHSITKNPQLSQELEEISQAGYSMCFGLRGNISLIGLLFIGQNINGRLFTNEDTDYFATVANHTGIALENSLRCASLLKGKQQQAELFDQLLLQKKMAAIGKMSTVLAHELKNPLAVIRSSAQYLKSGSYTDAIMDETTSFIIEEVDSLNLTINSLLGHAKHRVPEIQAIELQTSIPVLISKWQHSPDHQAEIRIECNIHPQLPTLYADASQLGQILLNLIRNCEEAIGTKGQITLSAREDQDMVVLQIADNGPGIPTDQLEEVFKNFFSTKNRGLGLGLPVCRQLLQAQHGTIAIANRKETSGTEVTIYMPFNSVPPAQPTTATKTDIQ